MDDLDGKGQVGFGVNLGYFPLVLLLHLSKLGCQVSGSVWSPDSSLGVAFFFFFCFRLTGLFPLLLLFFLGGLRLGANGNLSPPSAPRTSQMGMVRRAPAVRAPQLPTVVAPQMCPVPIQMNAWMPSAQMTTFWGTLMGCPKRKPSFSL